MSRNEVADLENGPGGLGDAEFSRSRVAYYTRRL